MTTYQLIDLLELKLYLLIRVKLDYIYLESCSARPLRDLQPFFSRFYFVAEDEFTFPLEGSVKRAAAKTAPFIYVFIYKCLFFFGTAHRLSISAGYVKNYFYFFVRVKLWTGFACEQIKN